jgi:hypothetical protein
MSIFAVTREAGSAWVDGGIFDQPAVEDHAAFMNALAEEGVVLFAGPLAGTERGRIRALLIVQADEEAEIQLPLRRRSVGGRGPNRDGERRVLDADGRLARLIP